MIDLYYYATPNGRKISIILEELKLAYTLKRIDILKREQFHPDFLAISPNNKIPVIVDHQPDDDGNPLAVFESGTILIYLAEKTGQLMPQSLRPRTQVLEWLMWQKAGLGPMAGQANHFNKYARKKVPYGIDRYTQELNRLYTVMNNRLEGREYLCDDYSIADIACYGWVAQANDGGVDLSNFQQVEQWFQRLSDRPAIQRALALDFNHEAPATLNNDAFNSLFNNVI